MQARFYDPQVGRFLSTDPVHFTDQDPFTFNRYAYANNNPYRYTDPTGKFVANAIGAGLGLISYAAVSAATGQTPTLAGAAISMVAGATGVGLAKLVGQATAAVARSAATSLGPAAGLMTSVSASVGGKAGAGAALGAAEQAVNNFVEGNPDVMEGTGQAAKIGAATSLAGPAARSGMQGPLKAAASAGQLSTSAAKAGDAVETVVDVGADVVGDTISEVEKQTQ